MSTFTVKRGALRSALSYLAPHLGSAMEDGKKTRFGRLRGELSAESRLVMWTGDKLTLATTSIEVSEVYGGDLGQAFDLPADSVFDILRTLRPPTKASAKELWDFAEFEIEVGTDSALISELEQITPIVKATRVPLIPRQQDLLENTYPDIPALIAQILSRQPIAAELSHVTSEKLLRMSKSAGFYATNIFHVPGALVQGGTSSAVIVATDVAGYGISPVVDVTPLVARIIAHAKPIPSQQENEPGWIKERRSVDAALKAVYTSQPINLRKENQK